MSLWRPCIFCLLLAVFGTSGRWRLSPVSVSPRGPQLGFLPFPKPEAWAPSSANLFGLCVSFQRGWPLLPGSGCKEQHYSRANAIPRARTHLPQTSQRCHSALSDCTLDTGILYSAVNDNLWSYCTSELGREDGCNYAVSLFGFKMRKTAQSASITQLERLRNDLFPLGICAAWLPALEGIRCNYSN